MAAALVAVALATPAHAQFGLSRISGVVADENGEPIKGAVVRANTPAAAPSTFTITTDEKGEFAILGTARGLWVVTVTAAGFEPAEISIPVRARTIMPPVLIMLRASRTPASRGALAAVDVAAFQADLTAAEALEAEGRLDDALALYRKLLKTVPALTSIHRRIGDLLLLKKDRVRALEAYAQLFEASPDDADARATMAELAYQLGLEAAAADDRGPAIRYLEQALSADPSSPRAPDARAALARLRGR